MISCGRASVAVAVVALFGILATSACSSDSSGGSVASSAGAAGTVLMSGGASGGLAGGPAAGASFGGGGSGGFMNASAGAGGSAAGSAGSSGSAAGGAGSGGSAAGNAGAGGGAAGSAGSGGLAVSFTAVKAIFASSCGSGCHNAASGELNFQSASLHSVLTSPIPAGIGNCVGSTLVVANSQSSYLLALLKGTTTCPVGKGNIDLMPQGCSTDVGSGRPCLTDAQIKTISDWIAAGAPAN